MRETIGLGAERLLLVGLRRPISADTTPAQVRLHRHAVDDRDAGPVPQRRDRAPVRPAVHLHQRLGIGRRDLDQLGGRGARRRRARARRARCRRTATRQTSPAGISASRAPDRSLTLSPAAPVTVATGAPTTSPTRISARPGLPAGVPGPASAPARTGAGDRCGGAGAGGRRRRRRAARHGHRRGRRRGRQAAAPPRQPRAAAAQPR